MVERAAALSGAPVVIAGDLNVTRDDIDVYDPAAFAGATHVTVDERSRLERLLSEGGLVDAFREAHPDEVGYTWWDYRAGHFHNLDDAAEERGKQGRGDPASRTAWSRLIPQGIHNLDHPPEMRRRIARDMPPVH